MVVEKRYLLPFILITTLFALWGVAANMTDTLLAAFRKVMQMSDTQTTFIQMAFYGAYFCIALPAALFIRKHSYKSGVVLGLILYAAGTILFLPAAWTASYAFYLFAIYGLALGDVENPDKGGYAGDAKIGASGLIMAILGGALLTPLQGLLSDAAGINISFLVPMVCFLVVLFYAFFTLTSNEKWPDLLPCPVRQSGRHT